MTSVLRLRSVVLVFALALGCGCSNSPSGAGEGRSGEGRSDDDSVDASSNDRTSPGDRRDGRTKRGRKGDSSPTMGDDRDVDMSELSRADLESFQVAWQQFVNRSPNWRESREKWIQRGGAAPYLLAENLFRYFWAASFQGRHEEVDRVAVNAARIGEPAVAYFAKPLATDKVRLSKPIQVKEDDPNNRHRQRIRDVNTMKIDDTTRRDAAKVLATIGPSAVSTLASAPVLRDSRPAARRYAARALGHIATQEAIAALERMYRTSKTWQDRSAAVEALGIARNANRDADKILNEARQDKDKFVREQAVKALAGEVKSDF